MTRNSIPVSRVTESSILNLDSSFANTVLNWYPKFNQEISIQKTLNWWINVLDKKLTADAACEQDILSYMSQNN
jgi:hypothetical protein